MIREADLLDALDGFVGWGYDLRSPRWRYPIPGLRLPQPPPLQTNCCSFAEDLLVRASGARWSLRLHNQMMIVGSDRFGPVTAAVEAGLADRPAHQGGPLPPWTLRQGWRESGGGHTFIVARVADDGRALVLEANRAYSVDGVGFRGIGNLWAWSPRERAEFFRGGWLELASPDWTLAKLRQVYPVSQWCALRVVP